MGGSAYKPLGWAGCQCNGLTFLSGLNVQRMPDRIRLNALMEAYSYSPDPGTSVFSVNGILVQMDNPKGYGPSTDNLKTFIQIKMMDCFDDDRRFKTDTVNLNVREYAEICGVFSGGTKQQQHNRLKAFRKRLAKDLELLESMRLTFDQPYKEKGDTGRKRARKMPILTVDRQNKSAGIIPIRISGDLLDIVRVCPFTSFPPQLFQVDKATNRTVCPLLKCLSDQYSKKGNMVRGRNDRLYIKTILARLPLPAYKETAKSRGWQTLILDPFFKALNMLKDSGVLLSYAIIPPDVKITSAAMQEYADRVPDFKSDYHAFENHRILFELNYIPPVTEEDSPPKTRQRNQK